MTYDLLGQHHDVPCRVRVDTNLQTHEFVAEFTEVDNDLRCTHRYTGGIKIVGDKWLFSCKQIPAAFLARVSEDGTWDPVSAFGCFEITGVSNSVGLIPA